MKRTRLEPPLAEVIVCHPARLVASATAALLERRGVARCASTQPSLTRLLPSLHHGVDLAIVFDSVDEEVGDLLEAIRYRGLHTPVLLVSDVLRTDRVVEVLEQGVAGLIPSSCSPDALCRLVVEARSGRIVVPAAMRSAVLDALRARRMRRLAAWHQLAQLTRVESRVLGLLATGHTVTRIAGELSMSPYTIRGHVGALGHKLGARGQLRIAAAGRSLLASARHPARDYGELRSSEGGA